MCVEYNYEVSIISGYHIGLESIGTFELVAFKLTVALAVVMIPPLFRAFPRHACLERKVQSLSSKNPRDT
jgi:hypothetical protein